LSFGVKIFVFILLFVMFFLFLGILYDFCKFYSTILLIFLI
jgi:hypothetical protein